MLPKCKFRGEVQSNGQYKCDCPIVANKTVVAAFCRACQHCDNPQELVQINKTLSDINKYKYEKNLGPDVIRMGWNFAKAVAMHVVDGFNKTSVEEYSKRLEICETCPLRQNNRCLHMKCGCKLNMKARWKSEKCPEGKWPDLSSDGV